MMNRLKCGFLPVSLSPYHLITLLFLIFWLVWSRGLSYPFVYDDQWTIVRNPSIKQVRPLRRFFLDTQTGASPMTGMARTIYRPFSTVSFAVDFHLWGLKPFFYRLENLLGHFLAGILLFFGLQRWGRLSAQASFLAASVFWLHPAQVETVQWVTQRSNIFCLLGILASLHFLTKPSDSLKDRILGTFFYGAALLSKEAAAVFPGLLFLIDKESSRRKGLYGALVLVTLAYVLLRTAVVGQFGQRAFRGESFWSNLLIGGLSWLEYCKILLYPAVLTVSRDQPVWTPWESLWPWVGFLWEAVFICGVVWIWGRGRRATAAALGWIYLGLFPVLGFFPTTTFVAERFLYIPMLGFAWILGQAYDGCAEKARLGRSLLAAGLALLLLGYGLRSYSRIGDFRSETALWESAVGAEPFNAFATACLALAHEQEGRLEEAAGIYPRVLLKRPSRHIAFAACNNVSSVYVRLNKPKKALAWAEKALRIFPDHPAALYNRSQALKLLEAPRGLRALPPAKNLLESNGSNQD